MYAASLTRRKIRSYPRASYHCIKRQNHNFWSPAWNLKNNSEPFPSSDFDRLLISLERRALRLQYKEMRAKKNNSRTLNLSVKEQELRRKIVLWRSIQQVYMPYASAVRTIKPRKLKEVATAQVPSHQVVETQPAIPSDLRPAMSSADNSTERQELAMDMDLCLPSELSTRVRATYGGLDTLVVKELRLRLLRP